MRLDFCFYLEHKSGLFLSVLVNTFTSAVLRLSFQKYGEFKHRSILDWKEKLFLQCTNARLTAQLTTGQCRAGHID